MGQIYKFLGLTVGVIVHGLDDDERKAAYACDITYGTNNELGFDYLRDNMKYRLEEMVQRGHVYAIVDEVDSILIDEARTPLIISGPLDDRSEFYNTIDAFIPGLDKADYEVDEKQRTVTLTEVGMEKVETAAARREAAQVGFALRHRERHGRAPRQPGAARPQAVPARQGLHRPQRRGRDHRRVHRPHDAGPALFGRPAPGARGQGAPADPAREPDARLDHVPELLPHVQEARRHDRHGADRGRRVRRHLQSRGARGPDQHAAGRALDEDDEVYRTNAREIPRDHHADRGVQGEAASRCWSAPPRSRSPSSSPRCCARRAGSSTTSPTRTRSRRSTPATKAPRSQGVRGAQRALPRAGSLYRVAGRRAGRDHHRHQHGRPRHRHPARRQCRHAHQAGAARRSRTTRERELRAERDPRRRSRA